VRTPVGIFNPQAIAAKFADHSASGSCDSGAQTVAN